MIGLLAVECLLWLSERFQWFTVNYYERWTALIAVASVGVAMLVMLLWFAASLLFHWRFQFSNTKVTKKGAEELERALQECQFWLCGAGVVG